jgi:hypothetical protein
MKRSNDWRRLRSLMSRMNPVNSGGPSSGARAIVSSTGNSVPSRCMPTISIRLPMTSPRPVSR